MEYTAHRGVPAAVRCRLHAPARSTRHATAPHRTAPHRTAPCRTAPHRSTRHHTALHCRALQRTAPHHAASHRTASHRTASHHGASDCTAPQRAASHRTSLVNVPRMNFGDNTCTIPTSALCSLHRTGDPTAHDAFCVLHCLARSWTAQLPLQSAAQRCRAVGRGIAWCDVVPWRAVRCCAVPCGVVRYPPLSLPHAMLWLSRGRGGGAVKGGGVLLANPTS